MRADDLFAIDVAAEVRTLCGSQIQGPWQVPAEMVRLANARGAARVVVDRVRGGFCIRCDGVLADNEELTDLVGVFDVEAPRMRRQAAIARVEAAGLSALLWATGLPGARLNLLVRTGGGSSRLESRGGVVALRVDEFKTGPPVDDRDLALSRPRVAAGDGVAADGAPICSDPGGDLRPSG